MDCREVRRVLWPADLPRIDDEQVERAFEHARDCETCRSFLEADRRLAELIRDSVTRVPAPRELRERLFTALARERAGRETPRASRRPGHGWISIAATIVIAVTGASIYLIADSSRTDAPSDTYAQDYVRRAVEMESIRGSRGEITVFLARELGMPVVPPAITGYEVDRAFISLLDGERGGVIEYVGNGKRLSFYILPDGDAPMSEPTDVEVGPVDAEMRVSTTTAATGLTVGTWRDGRHQHALVGNLEPENLRLLIQRYACPVARA